MGLVVTDRFLLLVLRFGTFACLAGWTWVHLYWEGPYGVLLWHNGSYALAEKLGFSWDSFAGSGANDGVVQRGIGLIGWLYLVCAIMSLIVRKSSRWQCATLFAASGLLFLLAFAKYVGAQRQLPMLVEYGGQFLMPSIFALALRFGVRHRLTVAIATIGFVMTFVGHGAYALGIIWPTPSNFFAMTSVILKVDHDAAVNFLRVAGVLDLLVCLGLFMPRLRVISAAYAAIWGLMTALARPVAGMSFSLNYWGADQFLHEAICRAPHFIIPLFLFLIFRSSTSISGEGGDEPSPASVEK